MRDLPDWSRLIYVITLSFVVAMATASRAEAKIESLLQAEQWLHALEDGMLYDFEDVWLQLDQLKPMMADAPRQLRNRHTRLMCWYFNGAPEQAVQFANAQLALDDISEDKAAVADLHICRGNYHFLMDDYPTAQRDYSTGMELALAIPDDRLVADAATLRGDLYGMTGELALSLADFITAHRYYQRHGASYWVYENLISLANTYRRLGDEYKALDYYYEIQNSTHFRNSDLNKIEVYQNIGLVFEDLKKPEEAYEYYQMALELAKKIGNDETIALCYFYLGGVLTDLGNPQLSLDYIKRSVTELIRQDKANMAIVDFQMAKALFELGQYDEALQKLEHAEQFYVATGNLRQLSFSQALHAQVLAKAGHWQEAYQKLDAHLTSKRRLDSQKRQQQSLRMQAEFESERKESENQRLLAEQAHQSDQMSALQEAQYWRTLVIVLAALLLVIAITMAIRQMLRARHFDQIAHTDELTGLANRRFILRLARRQFSAARKSDRPLSIALFDIDHFKKINDSYGHETGDRVLRQLSQASQSALRQIDNLGRVGGEEFLVLLPNTDLDQAKRVAERLRQTVDSTSLSLPEYCIKTTVSVGIAQLSTEDQELSDLISRADQALYSAKASGRNRVEADNPSRASETTYATA